MNLSTKTEAIPWQTKPSDRFVLRWINVHLSARSRGRNAGYPAPPAQIRTSRFPAYGSYFE
jgi:hypothetical protein